ncbi:MAG: 3-deoxy-D-manno-octulosonic acid transferase [Sumerlaeia bacterium]
MNAYDAAYIAAIPAFAPVIAYKRLRYGKYRDSLPGMLGRRLPSEPLAPAVEHRCWMHSVSVGETVAASSLYREFRHRAPGWEFLCTTTTETGQAQARRAMDSAERVAFAPADFSWTVRRFFDAYRPSVYLFFETEIWPNTLIEAGRRGLPVFMVNGKLSDRSARRYRQFRGVFREPLASVRRFFMQTEADAERMARVLGSDERIEVTGNVKFDALPEALSPDERAALRREWGIAEDAPVVLFGSTHPGEESLALQAFAQVRESLPDARLVIAPRHPERFDDVWQLIGERFGESRHRASAGPAQGASAVVLLDKMGVLARSFGAADVACLGGSWAKIGGHNLLEPAVHGIPVLRGPHMHAQKEIVRILGPEQGAPEVAEGDLAPVLAELLLDTEKRQQLGAMAREAAISNRGAAGRVAGRILEIVN